MSTTYALLCSACGNDASEHRAAGFIACSNECPRTAASLYANECALLAGIIGVKDERIDGYLAKCDALRAENAKLEREREEAVGVIETYGRVESSLAIDRDVLELHHWISRAVLKAAGDPRVVFAEAYRTAMTQYRAALSAKEGV